MEADKQPPSASKPTAAQKAAGSPGKTFDDVKTRADGDRRAGTRPRKAVQPLYQPRAAEPSPGKRQVKEGKGTRLSDIPNVNFKIGKYKGSDEFIVDLHFLLFKRQGKILERKRNVLAFSGLSAEGDVAKEKARLHDKLGKWTVNTIHELLDCFDMPRSSGEDTSKQRKIERLVEFLEAPLQLSDKDLAALEEKRKAKGKRKSGATRTAGKRKSTGKGKGAPAAKRRKVSEGGSSAKKRKRVEEEDDEDADEEEQQEDVEEGEEEEADEGEAADEGGEADEADEVEGDAAGDEQHGESVAKEAQDVSEKDLKRAVLSILKGVDIGKSNMRQVLAQLGELFGAEVVKQKKAFVKEFVVEYVRSQSAASGEQGEKADDTKGTADEAATGNRQTSAATPEQPADEPAPRETTPLPEQKQGKTTETGKQWTRGKTPPASATDSKQDADKQTPTKETTPQPTQPSTTDGGEAPKATPCKTPPPVAKKATPEAENGTIAVAGSTAVPVPSARKSVRRSATPETKKPAA